jgi:FlaA1/EpsC-like NDP-sugar epimerase
MIRLSGRTIRDGEHPEGDIPVVFTGLRPGEKLYEELLIQDDDEPTRHPLIRKAREVGLPSARLVDMLTRIEGALLSCNEDAVRLLLMELVVEYRPSMESAG